MQPDPIMLKVVKNEVWDIIEKCIPEKSRLSLGITDVDVNEVYEKCFSKSLEDLLALYDKSQYDTRDEELDFDTVLPLKAVMYYRVANSVYYYDNYVNKDIMISQAEKISELSKNKTSVYIHPAARIGRRFVIENGTSAVIGKLVKIGDDCYIHHGVTIGSTTIEPAQSEHPTIKNNVRIGACTRILGPVEINDNVCISPHCVITESIPPNCDVVIVNQLQLVKHNENNYSDKIIIYGIVPEYENIITIYGSNLDHLEVSLVNSNIEDINSIQVSQVSRGLNFVKYKLFVTDSDLSISRYSVCFENICIKLKLGSNMCITKSLGLKHALEYLLN